MSIPAENITEFLEPVDIAEVPSGSATHVLVLYGTVSPKIRKALKSEFPDSGHSHSSLIVDGTSARIYVNPSGQCRMDSYGIIYLKSVSGDQVRFHTAGGNVETYPPGAGITIFADGFVEWSMAALKTDIDDIVDSDSKVKLLRPRKFKVAGKETYGFIVEESPSEFTQTTVVDGKEKKGVNLTSLIAYLCSTVKSLLNRVENLEELQKGVV